MECTKKEPINTSVAALVPKNKTYSMYDSLIARVSFAAGCQISDFTVFWYICCITLGFYINLCVLSILRAMDRIRTNKTVRSGTMKGEITRALTDMTSIRMHLRRNAIAAEMGWGTKPGLFLP